MSQELTDDNVYAILLLMANTLQFEKAATVCVEYISNRKFCRVGNRVPMPLQLRSKLQPCTLHWYTVLRPHHCGDLDSHACSIAWWVYTIHAMSSYNCAFG